MDGGLNLTRYEARNERARIYADELKVFRGLSVSIQLAGQQLVAQLMSISPEINQQCSQVASFDKRH